MLKQQIGDIEINFAFWVFVNFIARLLFGMRNSTDGKKAQNGVSSRSAKSPFRAISSYLRIVSSGASTMARSAVSAASSIVERDDDSSHDQVLWAGFDKLEGERDPTRRVLLLAYRSGFQVWDVEEADNVRDLVSRYDGPVSFMQMLPRPITSKRSVDKFAEARPLLVVCADGSLSGGTNIQDGLATARNGTIPNYHESGNGNLAPSVVRFYSLRSQSYVHMLKFRSVIYSVRCSSRVVAICQAAQIHCFDATTLEREYTILTNPIGTGYPSSGGIGYGPLAVGPRWLAYSGSPVVVSNTGRVSPQHLTPSLSFSGVASNGSMVAHYAKESSKHLAAGIVTLGDMGYKRLSRYCSELLPDSHNHQSASPGLKVNGTVNGVSPEADNVGMVIVRDIVSKVVIAQFRAHKSPMCACRGGFVCGRWGSQARLLSSGKRSSEASSLPFSSTKIPLSLRAIPKRVIHAKTFDKFSFPLLLANGDNNDDGGWNNNNNNNNGNPFDSWWWGEGNDSSGSLYPLLLFMSSLLCCFCHFHVATALARSTISQEDTVWEVKGSKWTRLVPDFSKDTFVVATATATSLSVGNLWNQCRDIFMGLMLPEGFPNSVTSDYLDYSLWRGVQGVASQVSGVLATQALLYAVGLGKGAIPTAAAINWVLKDGIGYLSKIMLSKYGRHFDVHPKGWRLFADLMENVAFGLEMLTPAFPHLFVFIGAAAGAGRSAAALIQAATRSCFYAGFAAQRNFAEVIAKGEAQGMVSKSIGIMLGIALANCIGSSTSLSLASFSVVTWIHMFCNLKSYQSIELRTLNPYRASLVFSEYLLTGQAPSVKEVNDEEPLFPALHFLNIKFTNKSQSDVLSLEAKNLAAEIEQRLQLGSKLSDVVHNKEDALALFNLYKNEGYILTEHGGKFCVVLKESCLPQDMLKSLFQVNYLYWLERNAGIVGRSVAADCRAGGRLQISLEYVEREFNHVKNDSASVGWVTDGLIARPLPNRIRPGSMDSTAD